MFKSFHIPIPPPLPHISSSLYKLQEDLSKRINLAKNFVIRGFKNEETGAYWGLSPQVIGAKTRILFSSLFDQDYLIYTILSLIKYIYAANLYWP